MGYVAVKGGFEAIKASSKLVAKERRKGANWQKDASLAHSLKYLVDQVMSESSLYAPDLAAKAICQGMGNPEEAVFLLRAHRSTLPRFSYTSVINTDTMHVKRRVSASFKDIPGGQILGNSIDFQHRLLRGMNVADSEMEAEEDGKESGVPCTEKLTLPRVTDLLRNEGLLLACGDDDTLPTDITKEPLTFPSNRSSRLQTLTRGQTGAVTSLGYAKIRSYGIINHPNIGELRVGMLPLQVASPYPEEEDYYIGSIEVTEVEVFVEDDQDESELGISLGYGLCFGQNETKTIAMSVLDYSLANPDEHDPTTNDEFVLLHIDSVESTGFISHLKLPHYVTFQSKLDRIREIKKTAEKESGQDGH